VGVYEELGVAVHNARATYTRFGGSILPRPVVEAMVEASRRFVNLYESVACSPGNVERKSPGRRPRLNARSSKGEFAGKTHARGRG
jgi:hypothetical protein